MLARRDHVATLVDAIAREVPNPRVLSIGCGHLREAQVSQAVRRGQIAQYFAVDQDAESLAVVSDEQAGYGVIPIHASPWALLHKEVAFENLTLVYCLGMFDYLPDLLASRLTRLMFDMLGSRGRMLIANFMPQNRGRGYMSSFMDWHLIYRNEQALEVLCGEMPESAVESLSTYRDIRENVAFLCIRKKD